MIPRKRIWEDEPTESLHTFLTSPSLVNSSWSNAHSPWALEQPGADLLADFENLRPALPLSFSLDGSTEETGYSPAPQICFGTICNALVKLLPLSKISTNPFMEFSSSKYYQIELNQTLIRETPTYVLNDRSSRTVAVLNEQFTAVLSEIEACGSIEYDAFIEKDKWTKAQGRAGTKSLLTVEIEVNIYGQEHLSELVGSSLAKKHIFLQRPISELQRHGLIYQNPHAVDFPGVRPDLQLLKDLQDSLFDPQSNQNLLKPAHTTPENVTKEVLNVFDSLSQTNRLEEAETDSRIRTQLLPHQLQAVQFVRQREDGPLSEEASLWKPCFQASRINHYQHVITSSKMIARPKETGGGILADHMGLGKTLTMLASLVNTAEQARSFAKDDAGCRRDSIENPSIQCRSRATLIIVPSEMLLEVWKSEMEKHLGGLLKTTIYHGRKRESDATVLADSDVVLSTYQTLTFDTRKGPSAVYQISWYRIILDEAHIIRRKSSKFFRAMNSICAQHRWCLTGTPIQNSLEDLASLVAFIRVIPFDHSRTFRRHIIRPMQQSLWDSTNLRSLLESICLRRPKDLLNLPEVFYEYREVSFSAQEQDEYERVAKATAQAIKEQQNLERTEQSLAVFQLLLRLRRLCNHGTFQKRETGLAFDPEQALTMLSEKDADRCCRCKVQVTNVSWPEPYHDGAFTVCGRLMCTHCLTYWENNTLQVNGQCQCSICGVLYEDKHIATQNPFLLDDGEAEYFQDDGMSSKIEALMADIKSDRDKKKGVIFSCWTKSLDLVERFLARDQIPFTRIDGDVSASQRQDRMLRFMNDPSLRIMLMTTGTGSVGLDMTVAKRVYLLEPQWNPMVEEQAIGRVSRLGQTEEVTVIRYVIRDTVEQKTMWEKQMRKWGLTQAAWAGPSSSDESPSASESQ